VFKLSVAPQNLHRFNPAMKRSASAISCEVSLTNRQHHVWLELTIRLIESAAASENRITNANIPSADSPALLSLQ
jgi:hypothetical protein